MDNGRRKLSPQPIAALLASTRVRPWAARRSPSAIGNAEYLAMNPATLSAVHARVRAFAARFRTPLTMLAVIVFVGGAYLLRIREVTTIVATVAARMRRSREPGQRST